MTENLPVPQPSPGDFLLYRSDDGRSHLQVRLDGGTVWLTQKQLADLYQKSVKTVNEHLQNVYEEAELDPGATIRKFRIVQTEGQRQVERIVDHYSLEAILAVGYRVHSARGTQFRQWATAQLRDLLVKGFVLDDARLKEGRALGQDYFDELLERIRDIRASERRFYQKITDIYATSIDYDAQAQVTQDFYATVQNKLHWAIHGRTAAEIVVARANSAKPHMGLTTWKNSPKGPIRKADVTVAKNYLSQDELSALDRIVTMYLDYAELQAQQRKPMHMADWVPRLDAFLEFNEQNILKHAGTVSHQLAKEHAEAEFAKYETERRRIEATQPTSDFDKAVEEVKRLESQPDQLPRPSRQKVKGKPAKKPARRKKKRDE